MHRIIKNIVAKSKLWISILVTAAGLVSIFVDPGTKIVLSLFSFIASILVLASVVSIVIYFSKRVPSSLSILKKKSYTTLSSIKGHLSQIFLKKEYYKMLPILIDLADIDRTAPTIYSDKFDIHSYKINDYLRIKYANFLALLDSKDDYVAVSSLKFWAEGNAQSAQDFMNENYDAVLNRQVRIRRLIIIEAKIFLEPAKHTQEVEYIRKIISIITQSDYYSNDFEKLNTFFTSLTIMIKGIKNYLMILRLQYLSVLMVVVSPGCL